MLRPIKVGRFGLKEDPTGAIVTWQERGTRLAEVTGFYYREFPPAFMLKLRNFKGEDCEDVALAAVKMVLPDSGHTLKCDIEWAEYTARCSDKAEPVGPRDCDCQ